MHVVSLEEMLDALVQRAFFVHEDALCCTPTSPTTWLVAQNGTFKRGYNQVLDIIIHVDTVPPVIPGLKPLAPMVRWLHLPSRIPGALLPPILDHARSVYGQAHGVIQPIEQQYHIVQTGHQLSVVVPEQHASFTTVAYTMPTESVLCDIHSHGALPAFFSAGSAASDDADDTGLSVSVVIGDIFADPTILCRLNVYGHRQIVPATLIFDDLGPFRDGRQPHGTPTD